MTVSRIRGPGAVAAAVTVAVLAGACSGGSSASTPSMSPSAEVTSASPVPTTSTSAAASTPLTTSPTASGPTATTPATTAGSGQPSAAAPSASGGADAGVIAAASQKLAAAKTAKFALAVAVKSGGKSEKITSKGVQNFPAKQAQAVTTIQGTSVETRILGGATYTKLPPGAGAPKSKPWVKVVSSAGGTGNLSDPTGSLAVLKAGLGPVRELGTAQVAGVPTTRYATSLDVTKAAGTVPALKQLQGLGVTRVPVQVWIDKQGRLRQLSESIDAPKFPVSQTATAPATIAVTITYSDFGVPVHITAPPASQVTNGNPKA